MHMYACMCYECTCRSHLVQMVTAVDTVVGHILRHIQAHAVLRHVCARPVAPPLHALGADAAVETRDPDLAARRTDVAPDARVAGLCFIRGRGMDLVFFARDVDWAADALPCVGVHAHRRLAERASFVAAPRLASAAHAPAICGGSERLRGQQSN